MCKSLRSSFCASRTGAGGPGRLEGKVATLTIGLGDAQALRALYDQHLSKGRAFVSGADCTRGVGALEACVLVLEHAGRRHELRAEAVFVKDEGLGCGVGLQLVPLDAAGAAALKAFVDGGEVEGGGEGEAEVEREREGEVEAEAEGEKEAGGTQTLQDRIRGLSHTEQQKVAAGGGMQERIVLERTFGANVWESLLGNARLTIPEVAKIARKGTLPRPLVETIAGHPSWMAAPEVQRALLGNPRVTAAIIGKILGSMARSELTLVPQQTAYSQGVRMQARKLLGKGG